MIIVLISTYRDSLLAGAVLSAQDEAGLPCAIFEGPVGVEPTKSQHRKREESSDTLGWGCPLFRGAWLSDATKRTEMLNWAKGWHKEQNSMRRAQPLWILWLDSDELLMYGQYLEDMTAVAEETTGAGGFPLRLHELDGSVALCYGKIVKASAIRKYLHSSYQVELTTGMVVALPNVKVCSAGAMPLKPEGGWVMDPAAMDDWLSIHRAALPGEPHLLHRSVLRSQERKDETRRLSDVEGDWFKEMGVT